MAVIAAGFAFILRVHPLVEPWVELPHNLKGIGMFTFAVLNHLIRMATGAVFGGNDGRNGNLVSYWLLL